jgi:uncharacterized membrane protein YkvI
MIHGFNERIAGMMAERGREMSHTLRLAIAGAILVGAIWLADQFGLIALISRGYGLTTWGFWILFLLPILVVGTRRIFAREHYPAGTWRRAGVKSWSGPVRRILG